MWSFYLQFRLWPFSGTYPLIYSNPWSFYMLIHYMQAYSWSPYLSHITRSTCICFYYIYFTLIMILFAAKLCLELQQKTMAWTVRTKMTSQAKLIEGLTIGVDFFAEWSKDFTDDPGPQNKEKTFSQRCRYQTLIHMIWVFAH